MVREAQPSQVLEEPFPLRLVPETADAAQRDPEGLVQAFMTSQDASETGDAKQDVAEQPDVARHEAQPSAEQTAGLGSAVVSWVRRNKLRASGAVAVFASVFAMSPASAAAKAPQRHKLPLGITVANANTPKERKHPEAAPNITGTVNQSKTFYAYITDRGNRVLKKVTVEEYGLPGVATQKEKISRIKPGQTIVEPFHLMVPASAVKSNTSTTDKLTVKAITRSGEPPHTVVVGEATEPFKLATAGTGTGTTPTGSGSNPGSGSGGIYNGIPVVSPDCGQAQPPVVTQEPPVVTMEAQGNCVVGLNVPYTYTFTELLPSNYNEPYVLVNITSLAASNLNFPRDVGSFYKFPVTNHSWSGSYTVDFSNAAELNKAFIVLVAPTAQNINDLAAFGSFQHGYGEVIKVTLDPSLSAAPAASG